MTTYRIVVCARRVLPGRTLRGRGPRQRGAQTRIEVASVAWIGWHDDHTVEPGRLAGSGSFSFPGIRAAYTAVRRYLAEPGVHQVQLRTNQDRKLYVWHQHGGRVTWYAAEGIA
jgi:hypothetical protein